MMVDRSTVFFKPPSTVQQFALAIGDRAGVRVARIGSSGVEYEVGQLKTRAEYRE